MTSAIAHPSHGYSAPMRALIRIAYGPLEDLRRRKLTDHARERREVLIDVWPRTIAAMQLDRPTDQLLYTHQHVTKGRHPWLIAPRSNSSQA